MSDPASNTDIEDVLSSIRRLVSEEPPKRDERSQDGAQSVERLVLTPAFRVPDPEPQPEAAQLEQDLPEPAAAAPEPMVLVQPILPEAEDRADETDAARDDDVVEMASTEEPAHIIETALDQADLNEPETAIAAVSTPADPAMSAFEASDDWTAPDVPAPVETSSEPSGPEPVPEPPEAPADVADPADMSLEDRIAELEAAIQHSDDDWEPDGSEDGDDDETRPISENLSGGPEAVDIDTDLGFGAPVPEAPQADSNIEAEAGAEAVETDDEVEDEDEDEDEDGDLSVEALSAAIQALEEQAADAPIPDDVSTADAAMPADNVTELLVPTADVVEDPAPQPAEDDPEDIPPLVTEAADVVDAAEVVEINQTPLVEAAAPVAEEAHAPTASLDAWDDDDAADDDAADEDDAADNILAEDVSTIDEETLRQMVSDLVRDELQGVLGERITRNVRRLVRREIQRALAVRDLE